MAAPAVTARTEPVGERLRNGHRTVVAFALDPDIILWEKTIELGERDNGDPIDNSTMWNDADRTKSPRALHEWSDNSMTVGFSPAVLPLIYALQGKEGAVTVHFPNLSTWSFWGYLRTFGGVTLEDGTSPEATAAFVITNWDPVNNVESPPVYGAPPPPAP